MAEGLYARFSAAAFFLGPYKAGSFFFVDNCNKNLDTFDGGYDAQFDQTPGRLLLRKQMKLKCYEQRIVVARTSLDQGKSNIPLRIG
ncbi:hypothetical protein DY000_02050596 [Brassica cretica]|uniref:Uncharacterized protein n=1 Tax=Brassica cretica TaxID=69181 RepID=A0ABQ7F5H9_BRACR|nr:hypothetical protein DY000_02050596 [Brassica cretica]